MAKKTSVAGTPVDPTVGFTKLELGDKMYYLAFDFEAIATAEDLTGMELLVGVNWTKIGARRLRAMLYASMLKAHPEITLSEIGALITFANLPKIEAALVASWVNSGQASKQENASAPNPQEPVPVPAAV